MTITVSTELPPDATLGERQALTLASREVQRQLDAEASKKRRRPRRAEPDHVIMNVARDSSLTCQHCGAERVMAFPIAFDEMAAAMKTFMKQHKGCKVGTIGVRCIACLQPGHDQTKCPRRDYGGDLQKWIDGPDTGLSARTILVAIAGRGFRVGVPGVPWDPSDFGRCYRLLAAFPHLAEHLPLVADRFPQWRSLVDAWPQLTALYVRDLASGESSELWAALKLANGENR